MTDDWKGEHLIRTPEEKKIPKAPDPASKPRLPTHKEVSARRARVRKEHAAGLITSSIAKKLGLPLHTVRQDMQAMKLKANRAR